jgi:sporulation protein YlmC with PRC-barrel domain
LFDDERMRELEQKYEDYEVYDRDGEKIGKVDDLFVDETDREEYIGVKMGLFGLSGTTMIPMELARVNERERTIAISDTKDHVKDAPNYSDENDISLEYENQVRRHFGLEDIAATPEHGTYGPYVGAGAGGAATGAGAVSPGIDREPGGMDRDLGATGGAGREPGGVGGEPAGMDRADENREMPRRSGEESAQEESFGTRVRRRIRRIVE